MVLGVEVVGLHLAFRPLSLPIVPVHCREPVLKSASIGEGVDAVRLWFPAEPQSSVVLIPPRHLAAVGGLS